MKVSDLTGAHLDAWVAKAEGWYWDEPDELPIPVSSDWRFAGEIIARERIGIAAQEDGSWSGYIFDHAAGAMTWDYEGETPLIAAMRAYVASKFGVEVPPMPGDDFPAP